MIHLLIDGYNLIRQSEDLSRHEDKSLEAAREALIDQLSLYKKFKRHKITVVFDGVLNLSEFGPSYKHKGINVSFSPGSRSADEIIMDMVNEEKSQALVVSSDRRITDFAKNKGASTISSPAFYKKLAMAIALGEFGDKDDLTPSKKPSHKRWATHKKGPSKKAPKKERKGRQRRQKL